MQFPSRVIHPAVRGLALVLALQVGAAHAGMLGAEAAMPEAAPTQADADRAKVQEFLDKANVKERLQAMGVGGINAASRVDALDEKEVHALAQRIDGMPAGGALSEMDMILILLVAILVIVAL